MLDRYDVVILDDIGYVQQSREEMEVLFTFLAERYERGSVMTGPSLRAEVADKASKQGAVTTEAPSEAMTPATGTVTKEVDGEN